MKRALIAFAFVLSLAGLASAQETYSINVGGSTTNRNSIVGQLELGRTQNNANVCARGNLVSTCTQAQACVALNVVGGASCTASDAIAAFARIYPATLAGRESFVANELIRLRAPDFLAEQTARDQAAASAWCSLSRANRDSFCTLIGLSAGCGACR